MKDSPSLSWADIARFWSKVDVGRPTQCWPWRLGTSDFGYGLFHVAGVGMVQSHRVGFLIANGEWPEPCGAHSCDNPPCCNPGHIFPATIAENNADMDAKGRRRTTGHPGASNPNAALNAQERDLVRQLYAAGGVSQYVLGKRFGVTQSAISKIIRKP